MKPSHITRPIALAAAALLGVLPAFAEQFVLIDQTLDWTAGANEQPVQLGPRNWTSPVNYKDGEVFLRYEAVNKPSSKQVAIQMCVWQDDYYLENCAGCNITYTDEGVYYANMGTPTTWWKNGGRSLSTLSLRSVSGL